MEPITLGLLLAGGAALAKRAGAATSGAIANRPIEAVQDRIAELERLQQADALGLTGDERNAFMQAFVNPQRALAGQQMDAAQAMQISAQDSGEQLRRLRAEEQREQRAVADATTQIELASQQLARQQEQELLQLQMQEEMRKNARDAAIYGGIIGGVGDVASMGSQMYAMSELTNRGPMDPAAQALFQVGGVAGPYGYNFQPYYGRQGYQPYGQPYYNPMQMNPAQTGIPQQNLSGTPYSSQQNLQTPGEE